MPKASFRVPFLAASTISSMERLLSDTFIPQLFTSSMTESLVIPGRMLPSSGAVITSSLIRKYEIDSGELYLKGSQKIRSEARSLFCYWAVCELGISRTHLAKRLGMSQSDVVYAVNKGEKAAKEKNYQLVV